MTVNQHLESFAGLPVQEYSEGARLSGGVAWRLSTEAYEGDMDPVLDAFFASKGLDQVEGIVIGAWNEMYDRDAGFIISRLVAEAGKLPSLRVLFLADVTYEESEISWINQADVTPILQTFPNLKALGTRGGNGLGLGIIRHDQLERLVMQSGGLPAGVLMSLGECGFPALQHLELWLGTDEYGGIDDPGVLSGLLQNPDLPALRYLGLRDSAIADEVARVIKGSRLLTQLEMLDLSMGNLSDEGGEHLLQANLGHLKKLDLHHHYLGDEMVQKLKRAFPRVKINVEDQKEADDDYRYIEVAE